ncbi:MAG: 23S rRNA (adenine(2503)-C(2))-methyltransferase RlmN [Bacteroidales bacterium]|nr:23S rRNA (adenine(2503)-C(2))-methyltransferase RlmN [Bacteroidales bacterium]
MLMKKVLLGHNLEELKYIVSLFGLPSFTAKQIADWLYKKRVRSIDDMTNLSKSAREKLSAEYEVGRVEYSGKIISSDGTKKYLFMIGDRGVETVMIPDDDRSTICVSSQVGCKMGCKFCMTGRQGFHGHLTAGQILSQFLEIDEAEKLTNAVFMGMGEPLDNYHAVLKTIEILTAEWGFGWSPKRITLSTIGVLPTLKNYLDDCKCHLAVSLHDPFPSERLSLMPMQKPFPIEETVKLIKQYDFTGQRRVSFEYIMFAGINDTKKHADALIRLLSGLECRINLIRFHKIPDSELSPSPMPVIEAFKKRLNDAGIITTLRASRGEDVLAACGMLAGK